MRTALGLTRGEFVDLDLFQAERHTSQSNLTLNVPRLGFDAGTATVAPAGATRVGDTLGCDAAGWPAGVTLTYAWLRDGAEIAGATSDTRTIDADDAGHELACRVTGTRRTSASASSEGVAVEQVVDPGSREPEPREPAPREPAPRTPPPVVEPPLPPAPPIVSPSSRAR